MNPFGVFILFSLSVLYNRSLSLDPLSALAHFDMGVLSCKRGQVRGGCATAGAVGPSALGGGVLGHGYRTPLADLVLRSNQDLSCWFRSNHMLPRS